MTYITGATNLGQSEPENNGNKGVLYIPKSSGWRPSPSDTIKYHTRDTHWGSLTPQQRYCQHILHPQSNERN